MYSIYKEPDGRFKCEVTIQDGTERWYKDTLEEAIKSVKSGAMAYNHNKIMKSDIQYFEAVPVTVMGWTRKPMPKNSHV